MSTKFLARVALAASLALAAGSAANAATNIITNGDFESSSYASNSQFGTTFGGQGVTGWTGNDGLNIWFKAGTETSVDVATYWATDTLDYLWASAPSPSGGNFIGLDGDQTGYDIPNAQGQVSQTLNDLQVGRTYTLTFNWAVGQLRNRDGAVTEQLQVSFGGETFSTAVVGIPEHTFSGWMTQQFFFTPTATTQTLTFLSLGTPNGLPPIALLDGVHMAIPEPTTWAMMIMGFGTIGALLRRRRGSMALA